MNCYVCKLSLADYKMTNSFDQKEYVCKYCKAQLEEMFSKHVVEFVKLGK